MTMNPTTERILQAIADQDFGFVKYLLSEMGAKEVRTVALYLASLVPAPEPDGTTLDEVLEAAAATFKVNRADILSDSRKHEILKARHVACYAAHLMGHSHSHIGREIGRDHTTVMSAVARVGTTPTLRAVAERVARNAGWDRNALEAV